MRLAHFFGTIAQLWVNLQGPYELRLAEQKAGKQIKVTLKRRKARTVLLHRPAHP